MWNAWHGPGPRDPGAFGPAASFGPGPGSWAPICTYAYVQICPNTYLFFFVVRPSFLNYNQSRSQHIQTFAAARCSGRRPKHILQKTSEYVPN